MRSPRRRQASPAALAVLLLLSCRAEQPDTRSDQPDTRAAHAEATVPTATEVTFIADDFTFDAPAEVPAGLITLRLVNRGPSMHHVQLVKLEEGKTMDDFMAALKAGGPPPRWMVMAGGPNPPEVGDTASVTMPLAAGNYAVVCFIPTPDGVPHLAKGMVRPLTVTAAATPAVASANAAGAEPAAANAAAAEPTADVVMKLVDYDFELSGPVAPGRRTIRIDNAGPQPHEVAIVRLAPGKAPEDFAEWGERQVGPAPGTTHGGISAIMPGAHAYVEVDLQPGEYGLICFIPDMKDGKGHYKHGMVKKMRVG